MATNNTTTSKSSQKETKKSSGPSSGRVHPTTTAPKKPTSTQRAPALEPWVRQTVTLKLKEVDMSSDVFCKKMLFDQVSTKWKP